jgi:hypothetical protein
MLRARLNADPMIRIHTHEFFFSISEDANKKEWIE